MKRSYTYHGSFESDRRTPAFFVRDRRTSGLATRSASRLMERAGVSSKSARSMSWYDDEKDSYQHHAEYLKRLSKLREELIHQEQANLATALDRLRMRSYGREFVYSRPQKEKKHQQRLSASMDNSVTRKTLLTTFEKFQRMRPKKDPPTMMPLEGKAMIDPPVTDRPERTGRQSNMNGRVNDRSVNENVRLNLQRLGAHPIPSIPRQRRSHHRDIVLESSSFRKQTLNDSNNASSAEDRIAQMQKQKQKLMRLRHEAREMERLKLAPQSFRLDALNDEDRMNLEDLKDFYCIYYVPAPATSPTGIESVDSSVQLPAINGEGHSGLYINGAKQMNGRVGFKIATDQPIPPHACNGSCRMYVSGNKVESPFDKIDYSIKQMQSVNAPDKSEHVRNGYHGNTTHGDAYKNTTKSEKHIELPISTDNRVPKLNSNSQEKMQIRVDMPSIVYNSVSTPEPVFDTTSGLVKAFKQKELRQKELGHLIEDVRELNKRSESLSSSP